jgi:hypothetical protein
MSRSRILSLAAAIAVVALIAGAFTPTAEAASSKPIVGQCRTTTAAQDTGLYDTHAPVPCSTLHRMKTFAVPTVPSGLDFVHITVSQAAALGQALCYPKFQTALGGTLADRHLTTYDFSFFIPTLAQRKAGARWVRCDLILLYLGTDGYTAYAALPNFSFPFVGGHTLTDKTHRCLAVADHDYWTTCSRPHVARADQTFVIHSTSYPSNATAAAAANTACPGKRWTKPGPYAWKHNDHTLVCYTNTTS